MIFRQRDLFSSQGRAHFRIPSAVTTKSGTVIAFCNNRLNTVADNAKEKELVMCRRQPDGEWSDVITLWGKEGFDCGIGSAVYDENTDTVMCLFSRYPTSEESKEAVRRGELEAGCFIVESHDDGITWSERKIRVAPNTLGYSGFTHGSSAGITIRHGEKKGRLLLAARYFTVPGESLDNLKKSAFNCAIFSDDHGLTWTTGGPVQAGTGEGTLAELDNGTIYYNSRAYFLDGPRRIAYSHDCGETFTDFADDAHLVEPIFGNNASLLHISVDGRSALVFANPDGFFPMESPTDSPYPYMNRQRQKMTVQLSWDEGRTWTVKKRVFNRFSAYSSLAYCDKTGMFYLLYENGDMDNPYERLTIAEFDLEWLLS